MENIKNYRSLFQETLNRLDRHQAVDYALALLEKGQVTIPVLYEMVLAPALNAVMVNRTNEEEGIWKEHVMTSIVRTIIENAYPYVLKERKENPEKVSGKRVLLAAPEEEYHEIGIRMGLDFYEICGYEVFFIGGNTPEATLLHAIGELKPDILSLSVTNYLNLVGVRHTMERLRQKTEPKLLLVLSGSALGRSAQRAEDLGADVIVSSFSDIDGLRRFHHETRL